MIKQWMKYAKDHLSTMTAMMIQMSKIVMMTQIKSTKMRKNT